MSDQDDIKAIMRQLPHRFPFLLVDRVLSCEPGKSITAIKNVNDPLFHLIPNAIRIAVEDGSSLTFASFAHNFP